MKAKKIMSMLLVLAMTATVMGCSGNKNDESSVSKELEGPNEKTAEIVKSAEGVFEEPIDINVGFAEKTYQGDETVTNNAWMELYKEHGINVNVMYTTSGSETEKLNQMIMSGEYPDVFYVSPTEYQDYVEQGLVLDITDYFDEYLSDESKEYLNYDEGISVEKAKVDGRIYGIPQMSSYKENIPELWIRKDWLDTLGIDAPKTAEELMEVAEAFTNDDPDGNGIADTYGISINGKDEQNGVSQIMQMFGVSPELRFVEKDGKLVWMGEDVEKGTYGVKMLAEMYQEGTLKPDFVTADATQVMTDLASGKIGMAIGGPLSMTSTIANGLKLNPEAEFEVLPLPTSKVNPEGYLYKSNATQAFWCVSSKCSNPEVLFKIYNMSIDYICNYAKHTQDEYEKYCGGKAGVYTGKAGAIIPYIDNPDENYSNYQAVSTALETGDAENLNYVQKSQYEWISFFAENKKNIEKLTEEDLATFDLGAFYYSLFGNKNIGYAGVEKKIENDKWLEEGFQGLPTAEMATASANCIPLVSQNLTAMIMGNRSTDEYGEFVEEWKAAGGQEVLDIVNTWYEETHS